MGAIPLLHDCMTWLAAPWSGAGEHAIPAGAAWHGRLMVGAWGFAAPLAVLLARYFKVTRGQPWPQVLDNPFWWRGHRGLNYAAVLATLLAAALIWGRDDYAQVAPWRSLHATLGWLVVALALAQVLGGWLRGSKGGPTAPRRDAEGRMLDLRGDHYDMTPRRVAFEWIHKCAGYGVLLVGTVTIVVGLVLADAPRWMWLGIGLWWLLLAVAACSLQRAGRCIDTYQAIWGPDPALPGNALRPIGFGIRKFGSKTEPRNSETR